MISMIPSPRRMIVKNEKYHAVSHTVWGHNELWQDEIDAFCDSVCRIYGVELTVALLF